MWKCEKKEIGEMGLPVKLRWSESVPNLFSDWNNFENQFGEFVSEDPKIGGSQTTMKKKRKTKSLIGSDSEDSDVYQGLDWVSPNTFFSDEGGKKWKRSVFRILIFKEIYYSKYGSTF